MIREIIANDEENERIAKSILAQQKPKILDRDL